MTNHDNTTRGKTALVTGASRGLGRGIAVELARRGAIVYCADIAGADETVELIGTADQGVAHSRAVDVSDREAISGVIDDIASNEGHFDILVNNAGIYTFGEVVDITDEDFRRTFDVNVAGVLNGCRAAVPHMRRQGWGRIINTASQLGRLARPREATYSMSKAAVISLTQALALEVAGDGITVNCICPGAMETPMLTQSFQDMATASGRTLDDVLNEYIRENIPSGRFGTPEDMGRMVAWLASDDASFTTGSSLNLTGGQQVFF